MNEHEPFSNPIYEEQTQLAEHELSSFIAAVTELYGHEEAMLSMNDWLDESELMDTAPRSEVRDWRAYHRGLSSVSRSPRDLPNCERTAVDWYEGSTRYHCLIVSLPLFCCDAFMASDAIKLQLHATVDVTNTTEL